MLSKMPAQVGGRNSLVSEYKKSLFQKDRHYVTHMMRLINISLKKNYLEYEIVFRKFQLNKSLLEANFAKFHYKRVQYL